MQPSSGLTTIECLYPYSGTAYPTGQISSRWRGLHISVGSRDTYEPTVVSVGMVIIFVTGSAQGTLPFSGTTISTCPVAWSMRIIRSVSEPPSWPRLTRNILSSPSTHKKRGCIVAVFTSPDVGFSHWPVPASVVTDIDS